MSVILSDNDAFIYIFKLIISKKMSKITIQ